MTHDFDEPFDLERQQVDWNEHNDHAGEDDQPDNRSDHEVFMDQARGRYGEVERSLAVLRHVLPSVADAEDRKALEGLADRLEEELGGLASDMGEAEAEERNREGLARQWLGGEP